MQPVPPATKPGPASRTQDWSIGAKVALLSLIPVFALAGLLVFWHWRQDASLSTREYRVGYDHAPPYNLVERGQPARGLAVEVLQEAARRKRIRLRFVPITMLVDDAFRAKVVDLWPAATDLQERRAWLAVSEPYLVNRLCIVSHGENPIQRVNQLSGRKVSMLRARILDELSEGQALRDVKVVEQRGRREALEALCSGGVDAAVLEQRFVEQALLNRPESCEGVRLNVLNAAGADRKLSLIGLREHAGVVNVLRSGIDDMIEDGSFKQIVDEWSSFTGGEMEVIAQLNATRTLNMAILAGFAFAVAFGVLLIAQNRRLRKANELAGVAANAKDQFLATVSHEIRTPLNGILGMTDLMLTTNLNHEQREQAEIIRDSGQSLLQLINDLLDFSKINAGQLKIKPAPFGLREVVEATCAVISPQAQAKGLECRTTFDEPIPDRVIGDAQCLRQVLLNLLGNAVKFTDKGMVSLKVDSIEQSESFAVIRFVVRDTGIGIEEAKIPHLFEKFYQVDGSNSRRHGGTGLGLAITKNLVSIMGGRISVESTPGFGSVFTVCLPFSIEPQVRVESRAG